MEANDAYSLRISIETDTHFEEESSHTLSMQLVSVLDRYPELQGKWKQVTHPRPGTSGSEWIKGTIELVKQSPDITRFVYRAISEFVKGLRPKTKSSFSITIATPNACYAFKGDDLDLETADKILLRMQQLAKELKQKG